MALLARGLAVTSIKDVRVCEGRHQSGVSAPVWLSLGLGSLNDGVGDEAEPAVLQRTDNIRGMLRPPCPVTGPGRSDR